MKAHFESEKILPIMKCGMILLWYYAVSFIISGIVYARIKDPAIYEAYVTDHNSQLMIIIYLMLFFGIWAFDSHKESFIDAFRHWRLREVTRYMLLGISAYLVSNLITAILLPIFPDYTEISSLFGKEQLLITFIATVILPPIVEEYLFRHKLQGYLKQVFPTQLAIILQAVLFGILHSYMIQKIYAMLIGYYFGVINEKKGTVQCSIIMHMTVNGIGWLIGSFLIR